MTCKKCGGHNISVQNVAEQKKRGCFSVMMWILLAVCTCGLILIIPALSRNGSKTVSYAVCNDCGNSWKL